MPRPRLLLLLFLAGLPLVVAPVAPLGGTLGVALTMLLATAAIVDLFRSPRLRDLEIARHCRDVLSVGAWNPITLVMRYNGPQSITVRIHDDVPQPSTYRDLPATVLIPPGKAVSHLYLVQPQQRGVNTFGSLYLQLVSPWGLWTLADERPAPMEVKSYPDIQSVQKVELLARQNRLSQAGVRLSRVRGRGTEFDRLREYRREDEYRQIDWKATARHQDLISREYVIERNQNILIVLDAGRSMCNERDGVSHFDRALNAALLLSYVALRQGDSVGCLVCSNRPERWARPVRGTAALQSLIGQLYDLQPVYEATDYQLLVEELRRRHRKRSLVILMTNALDELHLNTILGAARQLRTPHLVLAAFLKNVPLQERLLSVPETDLEAFQIAAAAEMVSAQETLLATTRQGGLLTIHTPPEQLSAQLINDYLEIKARHLL